MSESLEQRVKQIVSAVLGLPLKFVTLDASNTTIPNWDSLNIINMMIAIESEFGIVVEVDEAANLRSVKAIMDILHQKGLS